MTDPRLKYHELGFLEVADKPTPEGLKQYYAELYYQTERANYRKAYPADELRYINVKIAQRAAFADSLRPSRGPGSMLDVGCGEGFALAWFHARGWNVAGIDHSIAGVEAMNPAIQSFVQTGDLFGLLQDRIASGERFDLVWLTHVLEHVLEPVELLVSIRKLVRPNGMLVVTVPNDGSVHQQRLQERGDIPSPPFWIAIPDHLAYFTRESLARTAESTGWNCREVVADFPIDWFLMHEGSNYVTDRAKGPAAHRARIQMELMLAEQPAEAVNAYYAAMARVGMGRSLTAFLSAK